ncbi:MAG: nicotinamidase [Candidatus Bathyarchaeota archaeon]|nr:nicotinamidase [Candidatus Bathyarchaeota archaeon]
MKTAIDEKSALILIDVQRDFCPGGSLPVPEGEDVIPLLNQYIRKFMQAGAPIFATRDWHPPHHISFKPQGGPWPPHCVQHTEGAEFHSGLKLPEGTKIVSKALEPTEEAYSGFEGTCLAEKLTKMGIRRLFIGGLATDYCVKNTVLDALDLGFDVVLLEDAIKGVDVTVGDSENAIREMIDRGAERAYISQIS